MDANVDLPREELVEKHQLTPASLIDAGFEVVLDDDYYRNNNAEQAGGYWLLAAVKAERWNDPR